MITLYLNEQLEEENRQEILKILNIPFEKPTRRCFNLVKDQMSLIHDLVSENKWEDYCKAARKESENLLKNKNDFIETRKNGIEKASSAFKLRLTQLKIRSARETKGQMSSREVNLELENKLCEALLLGIKKPKITLDAIGFIVISGRNSLREEEY